MDDFRQQVNRYLSTPCPAEFGIWEIEESARQKPKLNMHYVNMYDILPHRLKKMEGVSPQDTQPILDKFGKYKYQAIKKVQTTRSLSYSWLLWVDSEGIAVQPFSMDDLFDKYIKREWSTSHSPCSRLDSQMAVMTRGGRISH